MAKKKEVVESVNVDEQTAIDNFKESVLDLAVVYPVAQKRLENLTAYAERIIAWSQKADERAAKKAEWKAKQKAKKAERATKLMNRIEQAQKRLAALQE